MTDINLLFYQNISIISKIVERLTDIMDIELARYYSYLGLYEALLKGTDNILERAIEYATKVINEDKYGFDLSLYLLDDLPASRGYSYFLITAEGIVL